MAEFPDDAEDFKADLVKLGVRILSVGGIAQVVGYSESHVSNLLGGSKRYTPGARTKLGEMIAAKDKGLEVDLPGPSIAEEYTLDMGDACEPRYHVAGNGAGGWDVVEKVWVLQHSTVAKVPSTAGEKNAERIADLLNRKGG